jgi:hypothetical protein
VLEQVSKIAILRKLKQRFGGKPSATSGSASADLEKFVAQTNQEPIKPPPKRKESSLARRKLR